VLKASSAEGGIQSSESESGNCVPSVKTILAADCVRVPFTAAKDTCEPLPRLGMERVTAVAAI
jgi:hypothetical protein